MLKENNLNQILNNDEKIDLTLSYSRLSDFDRNGPQALIRRSDIDNQGIKHGSIVNDLLVEKLTGEPLFSNRYYVYDENKPSATLGLLCDIVLNNYDTLPKLEVILKIVKNNGFWSNITKEETLITKFNTDEFWKYLKVMFETKEKTVITFNEQIAAKNTVNTLLSHEYSKNIFYNDFENYHELPFQIEYNNFIFKGILDIFSIDHKNKKVYMIDLKTGSGKSDVFLKSFIDYRYYYQGAIYRMAFKYFCDKFGLVDYSLENFKFLFIGKSENIPIIFEFTEKWNQAAIKGFKTKSGYFYTGIDENLEKIYYHWKHNRYDFSKDVYEKNGCLTLNDNFIEVNEV
jgi:hypothetical protein